MTIVLFINAMDAKEKLVLKFFNRVIKYIKSDNIEDLTDFEEIDRRYLIDNEIREIIDEMHDDLRKKIPEMSSTYYRRNSVKEFNLVYMRGLCKAIGKKFVVNDIRIVRKRILKVYHMYSIRE